MIKDHESVDVFIGVDVGKTNHHAVALDKNGKKLLDKALPQDETKLRAIIDKLAKHGTLLILTAVLTIAMLMAGGVTTMEYATLIFALPVTIIAWLVMASFAKALRTERIEHEILVQPLHAMTSNGGHGPGQSWRQRLSGIRSRRSHPSKEQAKLFMEGTVQPALAELVEEFTKQGYQATLDLVKPRV